MSASGPSGPLVKDISSIFDSVCHAESQNHTRVRTGLKSTGI